MVATRDSDAFVRRLEDRIAEEVAGRDPVVLAFSGGLASTLVAMIARKRCELRCMVAGVNGAPDVEAAKIAKEYLDYRMQFAILDARAVREIDARLSHDEPTLTPAVRRALIPVHAVITRERANVVLVGFGSPCLGPGMAEALMRLHARVPLHDIIHEPLLRRRLQAAALALGLPASWAHVRHRPPAAGSGIERFLPE